MVENTHAEASPSARRRHGMGVIAVIGSRRRVAGVVRPRQRSRACGMPAGAGFLGRLPLRLKKRIRPARPGQAHIAFSPDGKLLATATGKAFPNAVGRDQRRRSISSNRSPATSPPSSGTSPAAISQRPPTGADLRPSRRTAQGSAASKSHVAGSLPDFPPRTARTASSSRAACRMAPCTSGSSPPARIRRCAATARKSTLTKVELEQPLPRDGRGQ